MTRTLAVTGGSGRLGRSVVRAAADAGYDVVSLDVIPDPSGSCRTVAIDLTDSAAVTEWFARERPDAVVHLAAIAVPFSAPESHIFEINTSIAFTVIEAAARAGSTQVLAASSPTVLGYGAPEGWLPEYLPLDENHPVAPWNAYSLSKLVIELIVRSAVLRYGTRTQFGAFRPCYVITPEEWDGAPTQQGHGTRERLSDPGLAAASLFNYVDARDVADFVVTWLERSASVPNGDVFFVGAPDAYTDQPLATALPRYLPGSEALAAGLTGTSPAFSSSKAQRLLGWTATRTWRSELVGEYR